MKKFLFIYSLFIILLIDSNQEKEKLKYGEYIFTDIKE